MTPNSPIFAPGPVLAPRTILVYVGLDAVGDGLMKLPFVRALRAAFPAACITWMAGKGHTVYAGVLAPLVDGLIDHVLDQAHTGSRVAQLVGPRPLAGQHFDLIIDTQRRLLTSLIVRRIAHGCFLSGAAGFALSHVRPPRGYVRPASMVAQLMTLLDLAAPAALRPTPAPLALDTGSLTLAQELLPDGPVYVGLAAGAGGKHKCWPLDHFITLARQLVQGGMVPVFLLGPAEADWADAIAPQVPTALFPLQRATGRVTPMLTIALGQRMAVAVANDSGTGHMLALSDTALVSLFGPTPADKFAPAAQRLRVIRAQDFGQDQMQAIPVSAVWDGLRALL